MSETSDFSEQMAKHPASLAEMQATAAWQFALGITDLTLYYNRASKTPAEYKQYCDYVGRLGEIITPAKAKSPVAVYLPIMDLWAWYTPFADPIRNEMLPKKLQAIIRSFNETCIELTRKGIPYCLVDYNHIAKAAIDKKTMKTGAMSFETLVIPETDSIPTAAQKTIDAFTATGGKVITTSDQPKKELAGISSPIQVETQQAGCLWSPFQRGDTQIGLFVNTAKTEWKGTITLAQTSKVKQYNLEDGSIKELSTDNKKQLEVVLKPYESTVLITED